jgi:predicted amidohydrolase YtcJ/NAD(P)H-dependent FMN reductase
MLGKFLIQLKLMLITWVLSCSFATAQEANLILHNAKITTLDSQNPSATAVAIKKGRIIKVGNDSEVLKLKNKDTRVLNAQGSRIIPGMNDSHSHYIRGGLAFNAILRWDGVPTLAEGLEMIRQQALRTPKGHWVRVIGGWTPFQFKEKRLPTPEELTKAAPNTPVYVQYFYSGFDENTKTPPGTRLEKGPGGKPTGLLIADPHPALLYKSIASLPALSPEEQVNSTTHLFYQLARFGLTSVIDVGGGGQHYPKNYKTAEKLAEKAEFPLRVSYYLFAQTPGKEYSDFKNWIKLVPPNTNTDPLREDGYVMEGGGEYLVWDAADFENFMSPRPELKPDMAESLKKVVTLLVKNRWPFRMHATYNESISKILDVVEEVNKEIPFNGLRWSIEHAETIKELNIDRIKALGGGVAIQDRMVFLGDDFLNRYGAEEAGKTAPVKLLMKKGVPVGMGTDGTRGSSFNPWVGLHWLVTGKTASGAQLYSKEKLLTREEALHVYTVGSAWFSHEENVKGRIAEGQYADLAVLSADYMTVPEEEIKKIESVLTVVDGKIVYGAEEFAGLMPSLPPIKPDPKILAFAGSLRKDSWNKKLVKIAAEGAKKTGAEVTFIDLKDYPLPIFDQDLEANEGMHPNGKKLKDLLILHDGFLIASPEYNSSITPVLKNAVDWSSRSSGPEDHNSLAGFTGKVAVIMSASPGALGGLRGLVHLRAILGNIGVIVLPDQKSIPKAQEAFSADGLLSDLRQQASIEKLGEILTETIRKLKA